MPKANETPEPPFQGSIGTTWQDSTPWWPQPATPRRDAPNIVLVLFDDVGFGSFGCYGAEIATPAIDALAQRGLRYNNFHVTPLCSPTRAALLTGRNHHSVGMGFLANADSGYPNSRGHVTKQAATIAEMLRAAGYNTMCTGKWHLAPIDHTSAAGPYDQWPLGRGFERYYGFLDALTDHFYPDLVHDNHRVDPPKTPEEGYHLTTDLIDHAIAFVRDQVSASGTRPFFLYVPFGTAHCPHQAPQAFLDKYRGTYDEGWDVIRRRRFERQLALGIVPQGTEYPGRNDGVPAWDSLSADEKLVAARLQEAFAAMARPRNRGGEQSRRLHRHQARDLGADPYRDRAPVVRTSQRTTRRAFMKVASRISMLTVALAAATVIAFQSSAAEAQAPVQITAMSQANEAGFPLWLANKLGYLKDNGVQVKIQYFPNGGAALASGAAGDWQAGWIGAPPAITGWAKFGLIPVGTMMKEDRNIKLIMTIRWNAGTRRSRSPIRSIRSRC